MVKLISISLLVFLLPFTACLSSAPVDKKPLYSTSKETTPKRVAVMPFHNHTQKEGLELEVRRSFYSHFSPKNFYDIELHEIDGSIRSLESQYAKPWPEIAVSEIGKYFNADFLIYGDIKVFRKLYLLVYSQMTLQLEIKMIDAHNGRICFSETIERSLRDGDIPMSPLAIFSVVFRSGYNIRESRTVELADKISRVFAEMIPDLSVPAERFAGVTIQVASFSEKKRALQTIREFKKKGLDLKMKEVLSENKIHYRVVGGPYLETTAKKIKDEIAANTRFSPLVLHNLYAEG